MEVDARAVRAGVTIACTVGGLVLFDLIDVDGDGVAVGVGYALDGDIDHIVVGRPDRNHAGEGAAAIWRLIGGRGKDIGRALIGARRAIIKTAPTTTVSPLIAIELPNKSPAPASEASSFCCWLHTPPLRTKT